MDLYRDELRRALRDADAAQRHAMPRWREAMQRAFDRPDEVEPQVAAALVGAPGRRQVLRLGGVAVLGAAVVAACGGGGSETEANRAAETGDSIAPADPSTTSTYGTAPPTTLNDFRKSENAKTNLSILRTAASIEYLAVDVYEAVLADAEGFGLDPATDGPLAQMFADHHRAHAESVNSLAVEIGYTDAETDEKVAGQAWREPNPYLAEDIVKPVLPTLITRAATLSFARDLENLATGTYTEVAGLLTEAKFRKAIMNIGGVEARHAAALNLALGEDGAPEVFVNTRNRAPDTAVLAPTDEEEQVRQEGGGEAAGG